jgi:hypothetical protein
MGGTLDRVNTQTQKPFDTAAIWHLTFQEFWQKID